MAVTLWKAEYHHLAFRDDVIGSQSSIDFSAAAWNNHNGQHKGSPEENMKKKKMMMRMIMKKKKTATKDRLFL